MLFNRGAQARTHGRDRGVGFYHLRVRVWLAGASRQVLTHAAYKQLNARAHTHTHIFFVYTSCNPSTGRHTHTYKRIRQ